MYRYNESEALKEATRKIERERLRSPRIQRNYIPPPIIVPEEPVPVEAPIPKSRIRKQMLSMMNIWNQRRRSQRVKRVQQRLQQQQQGNGSRTLDAKWQQLRLSMKYGELSDDFYSYCRRWRKDTDFLARGMGCLFQTNADKESRKKTILSWVCRRTERAWVQTQALETSRHPSGASKNCSAA